MTRTKVQLVWVTPEAEKTMAYCARVSSPRQDNEEYSRLLGYCIRNGHWSVFEMADMCIEITTSRAIAQQILRHRSFCFQEFSQRYAEATRFEKYEARMQDTTNRQNSLEIPEGDEIHTWFLEAQSAVQAGSLALYKAAVEKGIAKEQARFLLPLSTTTKLYMKGSVRSWIHYLQVRTTPSTQKEHRDIALGIRKIFDEQFPTIAEALNG